MGSGARVGRPAPSSCQADASLPSGAWAPAGGLRKVGPPAWRRAAGAAAAGRGAAKRPPKVSTPAWVSTQRAVPPAEARPLCQGPRRIVRGASPPHHAPLPAAQRQPLPAAAARPAPGGGRGRAAAAVPRAPAAARAATLPAPAAVGLPSLAVPSHWAELLSKSPVGKQRMLTRWAGRGRRGQQLQQLTGRLWGCNCAARSPPSRRRPQCPHHPAQPTTPPTPHHSGTTSRWRPSTRRSPPCAR